MLKTIARLEHKIGERVYHLTCDHDSPLTEVKEALFKFGAHIVQIEEAVAKQAEASKAAEAEKEVEPKPEAE